MRSFVKILFVLLAPFVSFQFAGCKKDKFITSSGAKLQFSRDSILFDTVFTSIGSATRRFRIRNMNDQKIRISSIQLVGGNGSAFKLNVDGTPGVYFEDLEIAAKDSMYVFVQVNVNPTNVNSPVIINDEILFHVNGNEQKVVLEAWGQDAWYHYPDSAIKFKDGTYLAFSRISKDLNADTVWKKDKPHVIYGYLAIDEKQKLKIEAGVRVYLNYKAGIWVAGGQIQVLGEKGNEVIFQGARREKEYEDKPGQWDRIWINEGHKDNIIDYAIIKNGYIGVQAELIEGENFLKNKFLRISNTKIQNMSLWGIYGVAFNITGWNNVISNCQEHSLHLLVGGSYKFYHTTFANFWSHDKPREKPSIHFSNYTENQVIPDTVIFANCIIDGKMENEITMDLKSDTLFNAVYSFSDCWLKTNQDVSGSNYINVIADKSKSLEYKDIKTYDFKPKEEETRVRNFTSATATDVSKKYPKDITNTPRNLSSVTIGAYELP